MDGSDNAVSVDSNCYLVRLNETGVCITTNAACVLLVFPGDISCVFLFFYL